MGTSIAFVTTNAAKFETARRHLRQHPINLDCVSLHLDEIQSDSVEDVAVHKARCAYNTLGRALIVEDSGFYIDDLFRFPGPLVKYVMRSLGAEGVARVADLAETRRCHFVGALVYVNERGELHSFTDESDSGTVADTPATQSSPEAWSPLWNIFIPSGCTRPLATLPNHERAQILSTWEKTSVFAQFGRYFERHQAAKLVDAASLPTA